MAGDSVSDGTAKNDSIYDAIISGDYHAVKMFADSKTELNFWGDMVVTAVEGGDRSMVQLVLKYGAKNKSPRSLERGQLETATIDGNVGIMEDLLVAGANPNAWSGPEDGTPLHLSCGKPGEVMKCLLDAGADMEAEQDFGRRPIHVAAIGGYVTSIDMLCDYGANVEARAEDWGTALHEASFWSRPHAVKALVKHGADVNARMDNGDTPLHVVARMTGYYCDRSELIATREVMDELLLAGADETLLNEDGRAPRNVVGGWDRSEYGRGHMDAPEWRMVIGMFYDKLKAVPADRAWRRRGLLVLFRAKNYLDKQEEFRGVRTRSMSMGRTGWAAGMGWILSQSGAPFEIFQCIVSFL